MKIALLTAHCYPTTKAGTEIYVHQLACALIEQKIQPIVLTKEGFKEINIPYQIIQVTEDKSLAEILIDVAPDIVHVHSLNTGGFTIQDVLETKESGFKVIATFHLANNSCLTNDLWKFRSEKCSGKMVSEQCTACYAEKKLDSKRVAVGVTHIQKTLIKIFGDRIAQLPGITLAKVQRHHENFKILLEAIDHIICLADWYHDVLEINGVEKSRISRFPQIQPSIVHQGTKNHSPQRVVFIGRLNHEKGIHDIIQAWQNLGSNDLQLHIIGEFADIQTKNNLEPAFASNKNITYHGSIPHTEVISQLNEFDVLILASRFSEMSPLVIAEAIEAGLPIIGSDSPGVKEASECGNHIIFPRGNTQRLAEILEDIAKRKNVFQRPLREPHYATILEIGRLHSKLYQRLITVTP